MLSVPRGALSDFDPQNCLNFEGKGRMTERATLHVLSDDDAVRDSLDALFQANGIPIRTYDSAAALLRDLPTNGCLLIDVHAKGTDPIELSNQFRERGLSFPTIILVHQAPAGGRQIHATLLQSRVAADEWVAAVKTSLAPCQSATEQRQPTSI